MPDTRSVREHASRRVSDSTPIEFLDSVVFSSIFCPSFFAGPFLNAGWRKMEGGKCCNWITQIVQVFQ